MTTPPPKPSPSNALAAHWEFIYSCSENQFLLATQKTRECRMRWGKERRLTGSSRLVWRDQEDPIESYRRWLRTGGFSSVHLPGLDHSATELAGKVVKLHNHQRLYHVMFCVAAWLVFGVMLASSIVSIYYFYFFHHRAEYTDLVLTGWSQRWVLLAAVVGACTTVVLIVAARSLPIRRDTIDDVERTLTETESSDESDSSSHENLVFAALRSAVSKGGARRLLTERAKFLINEHFRHLSRVMLPRYLERFTRRPALLISLCLMLVADICLVTVILWNFDLKKVEDFYMDAEVGQSDQSSFKEATTPPPRRHYPSGARGKDGGPRSSPSSAQKRAPDPLPSPGPAKKRPRRQPGNKPAAAHEGGAPVKIKKTKPRHTGAPSRPHPNAPRPHIDAGATPGVLPFQSSGTAKGIRRGSRILPSDYKEYLLQRRR